MTDLELIFIMLGEAGTTEIAKRKDAQGLVDNRNAAKEGGAVAGNARKELETKTGVPVVSRQNYLAAPGPTSAEIAVTAFAGTQTEALARPEKRIQQIESAKKKLESKGRGTKT